MTSIFSFSYDRPFAHLHGSILQAQKLKINTGNSEMSSALPNEEVS